MARTVPMTVVILPMRTSFLIADAGTMAFEQIVGDEGGGGVERGGNKFCMAAAEHGGGNEAFKAGGQQMRDEKTCKCPRRFAGRRRRNFFVGPRRRR